MLKETHGRCDSIALTKELLIAVRRLCHRRLALSVTFGATSPKERGLGSPFAQKEKEKFTKKCKIGCVLVQNVVSYKGVQK